MSLIKSNLDDTQILKPDFISKVLHQARAMEDNPKKFSKHLQNKIVALYFMEPSTRTQLSFESAVLRLGGGCIKLCDMHSSSMAKGETVYDTLKMLEGYSDLIVMRTPRPGEVDEFRDLISVPIINGGDGGRSHPTQTLLDLYAIKQTQGTLQNLHLVFAGDVRYARTIRSLLAVSEFYNMKVSLVPEAGRELPENEMKAGWQTYNSLSEVLPSADILYMTRLQRERKDSAPPHHIVTKSFLEGLSLKKNFKILHPLPRLEELTCEVDSLPYAYYFQQAKGAVFVRMALLTLALLDESA